MATRGNLDTHHELAVKQGNLKDTLAERIQDALQVQELVAGEPRQAS